MNQQLLDAMPMASPLALAVLASATLAGAALGAVFFGGLWWTVRALTVSARGAGTMLASLLLRGALVLAGFQFVAGGQWQRLLACLLGFMAARAVALRLAKRVRRAEAGHAS